MWCYDIVVARNVFCVPYALTMEPALSSRKSNWHFSFFFFLLSVFFFTIIHESQDCKGRGGHYFHPLRRHLDLSQAVTAESSALHIGSSRTRYGNLWFLSVSYWPNLTSLVVSLHVISLLLFFHFWKGDGGTQTIFLNCKPLCSKLRLVGLDFLLFV